MSLIRWKDFLNKRAVFVHIFYGLKTLCRFKAHPRAQGHPAFIDALKKGVPARLRGIFRGIQFLNT